MKSGFSTTSIFMGNQISSSFILTASSCLAFNLFLMSLKISTTLIPYGQVVFQYFYTMRRSVLSHIICWVAKPWMVLT